MVTPIPDTPDDVTPEWLTRALTRSGVLQAGRVASARWERVGQEYGFTGLVGRVELGYEHTAGEPPASVIVKLPMAMDDTASGHRRRQERDPALLRAHFERSVREHRFYTEVGADFAPGHYFSAADDARRRVVLVLEDLSFGRQGDVLQGCSIDDAALVLEQLAPFHARWCGEGAERSGFPASGWDPRARQERYALQAGLFLDRYGSTISAALRTVVEQLRSRLADVAGTLRARQKTLVHSDLHLDNLLFDVREEMCSVAVLDWQTVSIGPPAVDVAMFLYGSLSVEDRRGAEDELLAQYVSTLAAHGVDGCSTESLRRDCGLALLLLLAGTIGWLVSAGREATPRERALQEAALADGRVTTAVLDRGASLLR